MKSIISYFIKYPVVVNIIVLMFIALGIAGALSMKSSYHPLLDSKNISIQLNYPGASPQEMEEGVVLKIENNLKGIVGVDRVTSVSRENAANINVEILRGKNIDVVLADTAGRVHTDRNLVEELKKIVRVNKPDLKFLVIESIAGNDVVEQAKVFDEVGLDGVVLTKTDVDDKGGSALSLCYTLKKPICFIGTGQEYGDFEEFDARKMVDSIF